MIEQLMRHTGEWLAATGPDADIVITSRVRLARNLAGYLFTNQAERASMMEVRKKILTEAQEIKTMGRALFFDIPKVAEMEKNILVERHLISHNLLQMEAAGALVNPDEVISIMMNEEDHLRVTALVSGLQLHKAYDMVTAIDDYLGERLEFAFNSEWGYLTACPTNTGTGLRASVLVHLPALILTRRINKILKAVSKLNLAVRGYYGEGTDSIGDFFQISNQVTLGVEEEEILKTIANVTNRIVQNELEARRQLFAESKPRLEDRIWRAYGLLQTARLLTAEETMEILSAVRLGINMGIIKDIDMSVLNEIFQATQPAHLEYYGGWEYQKANRDYLRAKLIREKLTN